MAKKKTVKKKASNPVGRPTKYTDINLEQLEKFCKLGAIDKDIADFLNVSEATVNSWKNKYPEFLETVTRGKSYCDEKVVASLYKRATGEGVTTHHKQKVASDGQVIDFKEEITLLPDVKACEFWLKNRRPEEWRDKQEVNHKGGISITVDTGVPDSEESKD